MVIVTALSCVQEDDAPFECAVTYGAITFFGAVTWSSVFTLGIVTYATFGAEIHVVHSRRLA